MNPGSFGPLRLIVRELDAQRGGEIVLSGISCEVSGGGVLVVTGPNGCGKSTFLRVLAGLLPAASGEVFLEGAGDSPASHYVGHHNAMKPALSLHENLEFWRDFSGTPAAEVSQALAEVRLAEVADLPFGYLSTGQRRRVSLARLILNRRPLWLLDEPTAGLDKASRQELAGLMQRHLEAGGIIVAATHEPLGLSAPIELQLGKRVA